MAQKGTENEPSIKGVVGEDVRENRMFCDNKFLIEEICCENWFGNYPFYPELKHEGNRRVICILMSILGGREGGEW